MLARQNPIRSLGGGGCLFNICVSLGRPHLQVGIAHVGLPRELAARVRPQVVVLELPTACFQLPGQVALGRCLGGPRPCGQHLQI